MGVWRKNPGYKFTINVRNRRTLLLIVTSAGVLLFVNLNYNLQDIVEYVPNQSLVCHRDDYQNSSLPHKFVVPCEGDQRMLIILVKSSPNDFEARLMIRKTWGSVASRLAVPVQFIIGHMSNQSQSANLKIAEEQKQYRDLIVIKHHDTYRTLPMKVFHALRWLDQLNQSDCSFVCNFLADTDIFINVRHLYKLCHDYVYKWNVWNLILGHCFGEGAPVRRAPQETKTYVAYDVWPEELYPPYCSGGAGYFFTSDVPRKLLEVASTVDNLNFIRRFHIEDVAFTGVFRQRANITFQNLEGMFYTFERTDVCATQFISMHGWTAAMLNTSWYYTSN